MTKQTTIVVIGALRVKVKVGTWMYEGLVERIDCRSWVIQDGHGYDVWPADDSCDKDYPSGHTLLKRTIISVVT